MWRPPSGCAVPLPKHLGKGTQANCLFLDGPTASVDTEANRQRLVNGAMNFGKRPASHPPLLRCLKGVSVCEKALMCSLTPMLTVRIQLEVVRLLLLPGVSPVLQLTSRQKRSGLLRKLLFRDCRED